MPSTDIGTATIFPGGIAVGVPTSPTTSAPPNGVITAIWSATAVLDFPSMATLTTQDLTVTIAGVAVGDVVDVAPPAAPQAGVVFMGFVSAANTVTIRAFNASGSTQDPASASYHVIVRRASP